MSQSPFLGEKKNKLWGVADCVCPCFAWQTKFFGAGET